MNQPAGWATGVRGARAAVVAVLAFGALTGFTPAPAATGRTAVAPTVLAADLQRPRVVWRASDIDTVRGRAAREPYRTFVQRMINAGVAADGVALDDHSIGSERVKARAAKDLAFLYALDRTIVNGEVVPFPTQALRQATGDRARVLLAAMYTRSRLAVPAPLGGYDRDINTSEELLQYASAYDTLLGASYDFAASGPVIRQRITDLAGELYANYAHPETANGYANVLPNNHRSKSAASLGVAALALIDRLPIDPNATAGPDAWLRFGVEQVDLVQRYTFVAGDGAYAEGSYYLRYAAQNLLPFLRAGDRVLRGAPTWHLAGIDRPNLWREPVFERSLRWALDLTRPNGALAPVDDSNIDFAMYFGLAPKSPDTPAFLWRWAHAPVPYDTDGSVDLAADALVTFDDRIVAAPPTGDPSAFYPEGGNAVFRSGWGPGDTVAVVNAEHGTAMEFGRDAAGVGRFASAAHEHADPGSFQLDALGSRLALNPGYLTFPTRGEVNAPEDHNVVLVDGHGTIDPFIASIQWPDQQALPPIDGQAFLDHTTSGPAGSAAHVSALYGLPPARTARVDRNFLFLDGRYLVVDDTATALRAPSRSFSVLLHGNGGGTSSGSFVPTATGGTWTNGSARLTGAIGVDTGSTPTLERQESNHEDPGRLLHTHTVVRASATASVLHSTMLVYPNPAGDRAPTVRDLHPKGASALVLDDPDGDHRVLSVHRAADHSTVVMPQSSTGLAELRTDASRIVVDSASDGSLRFFLAEGATFVTYGGRTWLRSTRPTTLALKLTAGRTDGLVGGTDRTTSVPVAASSPTAVDGVCGWSVGAGTSGRSVRVRLNRERRFTLRTDSSDGAPAADPGPDRRVRLGSDALLDGFASCDPEGRPLTYAWQIESAPGGSAWRLRRARTATPALLIDRPGTYRVRLVVTDRLGQRSSEQEVTLQAGDPCRSFEHQGDPRCEPAPK